MSEMSLNKRQKTEDNYRRDSMSDRFGDDLCEVILQFLPLKDKLRLECVSKQFQRTLFVKHMVLSDVLIFDSEGQLKGFERLLQKIPNIRVFVNQFFSHYNNKALDLIIKYCHKITHLVTSDTDYLVYKFGPQLKSLNVKNTDFEDTEWQSMTNIEELVLDYFTSDLSDIKFKRLKKFTIKSFNYWVIVGFEAFVELNGNTITHFEINTNDLSPTYTEDDNENEFHKLSHILNITTKIPNLVHFRLQSSLPLNDKQFAKDLRQLALKCVRLKSLDIEVEFNESFVGSEEKVLSSLRQFKALKRLKLRILGDFKNLFSFKAFKGFQELTHLEIFFERGPKESDLTEIDINLPKLKSLKIKISVIKVNEETADILSRLSRLQTIELNRVSNKSFIPKIREQLLKNCTKISDILIK